jgi:glycogen operon protein
MLLAGDEFGRTQGGNNNAYCQDNEIGWLNWELQEKGQALIAFTRRLTNLRHRYPILRRNLFLSGQFSEELGVKDLTWINANGSEMQQENWADTRMRCFGMLLDGRAQVTGIRQRGRQATLLIVINDHHDLVEFTLPESPGGDAWWLLIDTNITDNSEQGSFAVGDTYAVTARSLLVFALKSEKQ